MKAYLVLALLAACLILVAGCTQSTAPTQQPATAAATPADQVTATYTYTLEKTATTTPVSVSDNTIIIKDMAFTPDTITVKAGSIVRWVNKDSVTHSVVFSKESKINPSGVMRNGEGFSVRFYDAGTFPYNCGLHPQMTGTVIVTQ
jgi:Plastocyanin